MSASWGAMDAGRVPLFDRLVDEEPHRKHEATPFRTLDRRGLHGSIQREVARILSTRCPIPGDLALSRPRTVLDYGLPDLDQGGRGVVLERRSRLARLIRETIEAFEPRLEGVHVELLDPAEGGERLVVSINAAVIIDEVREPISFALPLGSDRSSHDG
jgi:type VI secretion system protein ImpF